MTHIGVYKVLYEVRKKIGIHIGKINLGFFTDNSTGEIKKILMEVPMDLILLLPIALQILVQCFMLVAVMS